MVREISPQELLHRLEKCQHTVLVDVREAWERQIASLPGSALIPLRELVHRTGEVGSAEDSLVVVYCHHGIRSLAGAAILEQAGFREVASLAGGIDAWSRNVDPTVPRY